ncbi:MAG: HAD-IIIA family hydrolase [Myxococcota bacterium]|nr:HAD-IIIA family hydrolase [Myxococcota bacterium]
MIDVVRDEETGVISVAFHPDQLRLLPEAVEGMQALQGAGYTLAVATNQPGPAKGQFSADAVRRTNDALVEHLARAGVRVSALAACLHHPEGGRGGDMSLVLACDCRKPKPGMLNALMQQLGGDLTSSWMIGDSSSDIEAGKAAHLKTALVFARNRCELCPLRDGPAALRPDAHGGTLLELAQEIIHRG